MIRLVGINLPDNARMEYALTLIYGIGAVRAKKLMGECSLDVALRVKDIHEDDLRKLQLAIEKFKVEGDLREDVRQNMKRLREVGTYKGQRHAQGLPTRGQRTRSNARTNRGKRKTVGSFKKEDLAKQAGKK